MRAFVVALLMTLVGYVLWGVIAAGTGALAMYLLLYHGVQLMDRLITVLDVLLVLPFMLGAAVGTWRGVRRGMRPVQAAAAAFAGAVLVLLVGGLAGAESAALASAWLDGLYYACGAAVGGALVARRAARVRPTGPPPTW